MDVKKAVLNYDLIEEVHMKPPPSYENPPSKVCHLQRVLSDLKQVPLTSFSNSALLYVNEVLSTVLMILHF